MNFDFKENLGYLVDQALEKVEISLAASSPEECLQQLHEANQIYNHLEDNFGIDLSRLNRLNYLCFEYINRYDSGNRILH